MPKFGKRSLDKLSTCHKDLQKIMEGVIDIIDFTIVEGERTLEQQQQYFREGKSKLDGVTKKSRHQSRPSMAVDIAPWPINWNDTRRFYFLAGHVMTLADILYDMGEITHKVRWGGDWDGDHSFNDQSFHDLPHFELIDP